MLRKSVLFPVAAFAALLIAMTQVTAPSVSAATCSPTGFVRDGINMTAVLINPGNVSGEVDATGCNIGVYYDSGNAAVSDADIHGANYFGVVVNGDVNIVNVDITNSSIHQIGETPFNGAQHGVAVYYRALGSGSATGKVSNNDVYDYQKGGIVASGSGVSIDVSDNQVLGLENVPFIAQNGVQISYGASGQVKRNVVDGNWYSGASWSSSGILIFQSSNVKVMGNELVNNQTGIAIESWCYLGGPAGANSNQVVGNLIGNSQYGVSVAAYDYYSDCDPSANNNRIVNNTIVGGVGSETGIFVGTWDPAGGFTPTASGNKLINNVIAFFPTAVDLDGDAGTKSHANTVFTP